jgi:hypothetical protein
MNIDEFNMKVRQIRDFLEENLSPIIDDLYITNTKKQKTYSGAMIIINGFLDYFMNKVGLLQATREYHIKESGDNEDLEELRKSFLDCVNDFTNFHSKKIDESIKDGTSIKIEVSKDEILSSTIN